MDFTPLIFALCLTPVVAFVLLANQSMPPRTMRERGLKRGSFIRCPYCDSLVSGHNVRCPRCGNHFDELVMPIRA